MKSIKKLLLMILALALTAAACIGLASCEQNKGDDSEKTITVTVIDDKGKETVYTITTTSRNLRGALEQEDLVEGEESSTGLYVKYVNGIRADYEKDGAWWGFYKGDTMLPSGVDSTIISDGDSYTIKYEKA